MYDTFHSQGVVFLGITRDDQAKTAKFVKENGILWPNAYGADDAMKEFKVTAIPAVWIIGADGKVVWNSGEKTEMEDALKKAIAAAKSG